MVAQPQRPSNLSPSSKASGRRKPGGTRIGPSAAGDCYAASGLVGLRSIIGAVRKRLASALNELSEKMAR